MKSLYGDDYIQDIQSCTKSKTATDGTKWEPITDDYWVLPVSVIRQGMELEFMVRSSQRSSPPQIDMKFAQKLAINKEIKCLLALGCIKEVKEQEKFFSPTFSPDHQRYLASVWDGKYYVYCVLPFGQGPAPRVFTKITKPTLVHIRQNLMIRCT